MDTASGGDVVRVRDADGTVADITCTTTAQVAPGAGSGLGQRFGAACNWNTVTETIGGIQYPAGQVMEVHITQTTTCQTDTQQSGAGTTACTQIPTTVIDSSGIVDLQAEIWDLTLSPDVVVDNEA